MQMMQLLGSVLMQRPQIRGRSTQTVKHQLESLSGQTLADSVSIVPSRKHPWQVEPRHDSVDLI